MEAFLQAYKLKAGDYSLLVILEAYEESERLLYLEIDYYINKADNAERVATDFADIDLVRVPRMYREIFSPRVLVMESIESFSLTDIERVEKEGLDRSMVSKRGKEVARNLRPVMVCITRSLL